MAYSGGDSFPCVVGEVGSFATKVGFAGEDHPRSYFRSTTAIQRDYSSLKSSNGKSKSPGSTSTSTPTSASPSSSSTNRRGKCKFKRSYDFFNRSLEPVDGDTNDGEWEVCNPTDRSTGLVYQGMGMGGTNNNSEGSNVQTPSSMNSTQDVSMSPSPSGDVEMMQTDTPNTTATASTLHPQGGEDDNSYPGECYSHFSSHLNHAYNSALCTSPSSMPLLLIEKSYNAPPIRQKMMEIVFEEHNVPATFFARDAVCACYAVGRTTGVVADIGHSGTVVTPVVDGFVENKGILRSPVGTAMMGSMVLSNLDALYKMKKARIKLNSPVDYVMPLYQCRTEKNLPRREPFHTLARLNVAGMCIEDGSGAGVGGFGYAALDDLDEEAAKEEPSDIYQQYLNAPKANYKLPDGTTVDISQTKRFDVAELVFGKGGKSAQMRKDAVENSKKNLDAIIASGGDLDDTEDTESNAIAQMEEMNRRKRNARVADDKIKKSSYAAHEKLVKACTPYLSTSLGELTAASVPSMICDSAFKCDRDQQAQLLGNTILCGGGACLGTSVLSNSAGVNNGNAMPERIRQECEALIHAHTPGWRVKVSSPGIAERSICAWLGGSILGSLGSFHDMWITKEEYEEYGAAIINRKCP